MPLDASGDHGRRFWMGADSSFFLCTNRVRYFETTLRPEPTDDDELDNEWQPVIDMEAFQKACFHGMFIQWIFKQVD